jgi:arylsulfatase A-like enzyme
MKHEESQTSRRGLLRMTAGVVASVTTSSVFVRGAEARAERPNILFAIADDWGYPHAGAYGYKAARTPTFDRLATEGALFTRAFCAAPTCTASRGSILTGQAPHCLEEGANLWSFLPPKFVTYPDLLEKAGYRIGKMRKAWGPGKLVDRKRDPAGPNFRSFEEFLKGQEKGTRGAPFCFWYGSPDPHRPYDPKLGEASGIDAKTVEVPPYLPDTPEVRADIVNYLAEVQRFDRELGDALKLLEARGLAQDTLVAVTGDNGWPFPRAKANLYDAGTRVPLAIRWPARVKGGLVVHRVTSLTDLAPTFLQAAGLDVPADMTGTTFLSLVLGQGITPPENVIVIERERHARARAGNVGYPARALRTDRWLYVRNFFPERWPAGDPDLAASQGVFSDIDAGPTKTQLLENRERPAFARAFHLATDKRAAEELYDLDADPHGLRNLAADPEFAGVKKRAGEQLSSWMRRTKDPRFENPRDGRWDGMEYFGPG